MFRFRVYILRNYQGRNCEIRNPIRMLFSVLNMQITELCLYVVT